MDYSYSAQVFTYLRNQLLYNSQTLCQSICYIKYLEAKYITSENKMSNNNYLLYLSVNMDAYFLF